MLIFETSFKFKTLTYPFNKKYILLSISPILYRIFPLLKSIYDKFSAKTTDKFSLSEILFDFNYFSNFSFNLVVLIYPEIILVIVNFWIGEGVFIISFKKLEFNSLLFFRVEFSIFASEWERSKNDG